MLLHDYRAHKPHLERRTKASPPRRTQIPRAVVDTPDTEEAQEWGERIDTGRTIARAGRSEGDVPGATPEL